MANDFYSDTEDDQSAPETAQSDMPDKPDEEQAEGETALLPKSIFGSKMPEPGATCTFKVVHVYDDEVEVEYAKEDEDDSEMGKADSALTALGQAPDDGA